MRIANKNKRVGRPRKDPATVRSVSATWKMTKDEAADFAHYVRETGLTIGEVVRDALRCRGILKSPDGFTVYRDGKPVGRVPS